MESLINQESWSLIFSHTNKPCFIIVQPHLPAPSFLHHSISINRLASVQVIRKHIPLGCRCKDHSKSFLEVEYHVVCVNGQDLLEMGGCQNGYRSACATTQQKTVLLYYL